MASINYAAREINIKIVYYGAALCGKTTNLNVIHGRIPEEKRSKLVSLATSQDRTLFFDFLNVDLGEVRGFSTKFQLYTVPGQTYYAVTRKLVLRGVDGVVFVVDSAPDKMQENIESFAELWENLAAMGFNQRNIPVVVQHNKRDARNAVPIEQLERTVNSYGFPYCEAVAVNGKGVFETLRSIAKLVIEELNRKYSRPAAPMPPIRPAVTTLSAPEAASAPQARSVAAASPQPIATPPKKTQISPTPAAYGAGARIPAATAAQGGASQKVSTAQTREAEVAVLEHEVALVQKTPQSAPVAASKPQTEETVSEAEIEVSMERPLPQREDPEVDEFERAILEQKKKS